jgi:WhiB family transcriptional regulator, redox-sensing transcriptional regulator
VTPEELERLSAAILADRSRAPAAALVRWMMGDVFGEVGPGVELPAWRRRAACAGKPLAWFVPDTPRGRRPDYRQALATCERCPVRVECAEDAYANGDDDGVRGGLTPEARAQAHRDDRVAA